MGLFFYMITILFGLDVFGYIQQTPSVFTLYKIFPGLWPLSFLPLVTAYIGYIVSNNFSNIIRAQNKHLKQEETRSLTVLEFIDNLRKGNFQDSFSLSESKDKLSESSYNFV